MGHQALVRSLNDLAAPQGLQSAIFTFSSHPMEVVAPGRAPLLLSTPAQKEEWLRQAGAQKVVTLDFNAALRALPARDFMRMLADNYGVKLLVMGFNHRFGHDRISDFQTYRQIGASMGMQVEQADEELADNGLHVSSSAIRRAIAAGDIVTANVLLGRPYSIVGTVAHGQGIGRTIGFPTANVVPIMPRQLIPANGVYAAAIIIDEAIYPAMVNIGTRPTIGDALPPTIEANVIGLDADLYGMTVEVAFLQRLRNEQKFPSLADLKAQLSADREAALTIFSECTWRQPIICK